MKLDKEIDGTIKLMREKIGDKMLSYAKALKEQGGYKDFETRFCSDCLRASVGTNTICEWYDKYNCNDTHVLTLAKKAVKIVCPESLGV